MRRTADMRALGGLLALLAVLTVSAPAAAQAIKVNQPLPSGTFVDQAGKTFSFDAWRGKFGVISFIYTRCRDPKECPLTTAKFAQLQNKLGPKTQLAEISLDPAYDRPPVLAAYGKGFGLRPDRVVLLTGDPKSVMGFAGKLGVTAFTDPKAGFVHNELTVVVAPSGNVVEMIPENSWTPDEIASIIAHYQQPLPLVWTDVIIGAIVIAVVAAVVVVAIRMKSA